MQPTRQNLQIPSQRFRSEQMRVRREALNLEVVYSFSCPHTSLSFRWLPFYKWITFISFQYISPVRSVQIQKSILPLAWCDEKLSLIFTRCNIVCNCPKMTADWCYRATARLEKSAISVNIDSAQLICVSKDSVIRMNYINSFTGIWTQSRHRMSVVVRSGWIKRCDKSFNLTSTEINHK